MTLILAGIIWLISLAEVFRFGFFLGKRCGRGRVQTVGEKEKRAAERAARELKNMLEYDGSEQ